MTEYRIGEHIYCPKCESDHARVRDIDETHHTIWGECSGCGYFSFIEDYEYPVGTGNC